MVTHCPLLMHFALPPLPAGVSLEDVMAYDAELANPTGILTSLTRPPRYWDHAFGGVIVADQCGWAMGVEGGKGVRRDDYWRQSINCESDWPPVELTIPQTRHTPPSPSSSFSFFLSVRWKRHARLPPSPRYRSGWWSSSASRTRGSLAPTSPSAS